MRVTQGTLTRLLTSIPPGMLKLPGPGEIETVILYVNDEPEPVVFEGPECLVESEIYLALTYPDTEFSYIEVRG